MIRVRTMETIPAGDSPFQHDLSNMGTVLGTNITVMYKTFPKERMEFLIVVNKDTGERVRLEFTEVPGGPDFMDTLMNGGLNVPTDEEAK